MDERLSQLHNFRRAKSVQVYASLDSNLILKEIVAQRYLMTCWEFCESGRQHFEYSRKRKLILGTLGNCD
jgi:hypothetical protein